MRAAYRTVMLTANLRDLVIFTHLRRPMKEMHHVFQVVNVGSSPLPCPKISGRRGRPPPTILLLTKLD